MRNKPNAKARDPIAEEIRVFNFVVNYHRRKGHWPALVKVKSRLGRKATEVVGIVLNSDRLDYTVSASSESHIDNVLSWIVQNKIG